MSSARRRRLLRILELVATQPMRTQEELAEVLAHEGFTVTQSSVSRDIAALGLVKADGVYRRPPPDALKVLDPDELRIREGLLSLDLAGDVLVVVHTPPGEANRVGVAIDRLGWTEVVGTLAGDDTIFLATRNRASQRRTAERLREIAGTGQVPA